VCSATTEQLAKVQTILQHLDHAQPASDAENRRRAPRVTVRLTMNVIVLGVVNPAPVCIHSRNFSVSGIGFVSRRLFKSGERIVIQLRGKALPPKLILARITFSRYASGGHYEMGAEFLESLPDLGNTRIPSHWLLSGGSKVAKSPAKTAS